MIKTPDNLEKNIHEKTNYSTIIHIEPKEIKHDLQIRKRIIENILNNQKEIISFHKIHIIRGVENDNINIHLVVDSDMSISDSHDLCHRLKSILQKKYGSCDVDIHFEPCCKDCKICKISCQKRII